MNSISRRLQSESDMPSTEPETLEPETTIPYVVPGTESDMPSTEPETLEPETTIPYVVPGHQEDTTVPVVGPEGPQGSGSPTTPGGSGSPIPSHNETETESPGTSEPATTNPNVRPIPGHENDPITTIPSVISTQTYDPVKTEPSLLLLVGVGNFKLPKKQPNVVVEPVVVFEIYYKRVFGKTILSVRMYVFIKVTYRRLRSLEEGGGEETEEKEERAACDRITFDEDPNIRYNCSFGVDENAELDKVTMNPSTPPTFEGMSESVAPAITVSSLANETMSEKGIQSATGNELLKTQYLMNNTVLEENGLRFKLTGEMDTYIPDNNIILSFDEKGNGKIKNASCDVNYLQGNIFELDCLAEKGINSHLNGVNGITTHSGEKVIIYMKPGTDEVLNAGSNYMGLYNRGSSSGLSGGAIAGIVIACVIALLAIAIGAMLCRKTSVPAPFQESTLGVNTSNMTD